MFFNWLKKIFSVNPQWRSSLMHPTQYRPPSSSEVPYKPSDEKSLTEEEYRYYNHRDQKRNPSPTIIINVNEDTINNYKPERYTLEEEKIDTRNPGEYFNIKYYK